MGLEGRKIDDNVVMFGEPLNEKALNALKSRSPTADSILSSLPPSAFIPIQDMQVSQAEEEVVEEEPIVDTAKDRRMQKRLRKKKALLQKEAEEKANQEKIKEQLVQEQTILSSFIEEKETEMDLEKELEALSSQAKPKVVEPEPQPEPVQEQSQDLKSQILELLQGEENAPTLELIDAWKEQYGRSGIHVMAFGEGEVYIYHHLTRGEWKKLKELMAKLQESENADEIEEKLKEKIVLHCILWPSVNPQWLDNCKAGVVDSLYQMILLNSGFLTPQQAMLLTTQL